MDQDELRKLMDCCRPVGRDGRGGELAEPEMAALVQAIAENPQVGDEFRAVQAWDASIGSAMKDVPVPEGLASRLLVVLEQAECVVGGGSATPLSVEQRRWWNRWPVRVAASVVSVAALVAIAFYLARPDDNLTAAQVAESALQWRESLNPESWQTIQEPLDRYPVDRSLRFYVVGWQPLDALGDSDSVAYLAHLPQGQSNAYLLVLRTSRGRALDPVPPRNPDATTGGFCVGVWKKDDCLYVLMVPGNRSEYRRLLKSQAIACGPHGVTLRKV